MSGVPKRSHEEGGVTHPSSAAKYPHEDSGSSYPKSTHPSVTPPPPPAQVHHHHLHSIPHPLTAAAASAPSPAAAYEVESRTTVKGPRSEPRDGGERRSPLHGVYRSPSLPATVSSSDPHLTHAPVPLESRDGTKDVSRDNRSDGREVYGEAKREIQGPKGGDRDAKFERSGDDFGGKGNPGSYARGGIYGEAKREIQGPKSDRDAKSERLGDDFSGKGNTGSYTKFDRENQNYNDQKADVKMEKDGHAHLPWKEQKDYHRGKRAESSSANVEPWVVSRSNPQGSTEVGVKDLSALPVEGAHLEGLGENKVDAKSEDRFKDKDKKRKDLKHREWGDRDKDRNDRRGSVLVGSVMSEPKEIGRETERWERERMEQNDRERNKEKEKEKDHIKREPRTGAEKEASQNEKELGEASSKPAEQEHAAPEQKKQNEPEGWEKDERESKEKRRERDGDSEAERAEKRSRVAEKESEDGCLEGEGEREKDAFNCGVQQRKRMLRPRGSPQTTNRDRVRSRSQDNNEGVQGKSEVPIVVYKVGECMQELIKLWKEYESSHPDKSGDFASNGPTLEVRIPAEHVTATNRQVRGGQLWGTDIYTDDSDLVAVLMHTGYCRPTASPPPPTMQELRATIRVLPSQDYYTSKLRNNVRSRAWGAGIGCSYKVERCYILKKGGGTIELEPSLTHSSTVEPTLAPMAVERSMTTRAAASNALRQQRFVREVTIQYNLCNEPWIKYSISIVADKGLKKPLFTSARLKKGEVLYLETHSCRYELCFAGEKTMKAFQASQQQQQHSSQEAMEMDNNNNKPQNHLPSNGDKTESDNSIIDVFRWSRCKKPLPQKLMRSIGFPLPPDHVEVLEENLDWEDVQWSQTGVWIAGKEYTLARVHFLAPN
ncbi:hypothetical protein N665_0870s0026 [Sinapis alba]|nr:hypothetical protein N665_0870s0026 [Sinapis alba]